MNQIDKIFGYDTVYLQNDLDSNDDSDNDEEDSPIIVPLEEIEEAMNRPTTNYQVTPDTSKYVQNYPFLFASLCPGEDVLMACARILDERNDVTLVREAAHYLDNVESKK
jgi:A1 cistron-splicing factor AAR2